MVASLHTRGVKYIRISVSVPLSSSFSQLECQAVPDRTPQQLRATALERFKKLQPRARQLTSPAVLGRRF